MNCELYQALSVVEKYEYIGKLLHAAQSHDYFFMAGQKIIEAAEEKGFLNGVTIMPEIIGENVAT